MTEPPAAPHTPKSASVADSTRTPAATGRPKPRWHLHRRLYEWVLHWADTPYGAPALFVLAFAESSFFPVPPDVLLIALVLGARTRWLRLAAVCTVASVLGGIAGYGIGLGLMDSVGRRIIDFYHAQDHWERVAAWYGHYGVWIVFIAAFTPIPYKVFTIASGAFDLNLAAFCVVSAIGRGARFFLVAGLLYLFGPPMKRFIDRYFDWLALAFVVLLIGGFAVIKLIDTGG